MTFRQRILKLLYPLFTLYTRKKQNIKVLENKTGILPPVSFYTLQILLSDGKQFFLENLRGKIVLLVNTASDCGYTAQYEELQQLYQRSGHRLEIIAFPSNDFREQEKENDEEIARFCRINYNIKFLLAKKSVVIKSDEQNAVFKWLTTKELNGWNSRPPRWNFSKYLVNEEGVLINYFDPSVSPLSDDVQKALNL
jgi:glutathione peroxidase